MPTRLDTEVNLSLNYGEERNDEPYSSNIMSIFWMEN